MRKRKKKTTKELGEIFKKDFFKALNKLEEKHGLQLECRRFGFHKTKGFRIEVLGIPNPHSEVQKTMYLENCERFGLKKEWLGLTLDIEGKYNYKFRGTIVGLNPRASDYKVLVLDSRYSNINCTTIEKLKDAIKNRTFRNIIKNSTETKKIWGDDREPTIKN